MAKNATLESVIALLREESIPVAKIETYLKMLNEKVSDLETSVEESLGSIALLESELVKKAEALAALTAVRDTLSTESIGMMTQVSEVSASRDALQGQVNGLNDTNGKHMQTIESLRRTVADLESQLGNRRQKQVDAILGRMEVCGKDGVIRERFRQRLPQLNFEDLDGEWESISDEFNRLFVVSPVTVPSRTQDDEAGLSARNYSSYRVRRE